MEKSSSNEFVKMLHRVKEPRFAAMLALGFASGLPLMMLFSKLSIRLKDVGIDKSTIGFMYWITIAYTLKWLWSPAVDRIKIPFLTDKLGRRRSWMVVGMLGTTLGLLVIGFSDPAEALWVTLVGATILAYSGATLDIAIDAWRIESAKTTDQGYMAAIYQLGYRLAIMFSGVGVALADYFAWYVTFGLMAFVMLVGAALVLIMQEPDVERIRQREAKSFHKAIYDSIVEPFSQLAVRLDVWIVAVIGIVALYRLPDFTMGVMAGPLYVDLGYTKTQIGLYQSGFGPWFLIAGAFIGGVAIAKFGVVKSMLIGAPLTFFTTAAYAWLASLGQPDQADLIREANNGQLVGVTAPAGIWLFAAIGADNIAGGFVGTAFIAYLSSLTDPKNAATQYACLSSLYAFLCKLVAGFSGVIAENIGYAGLFLLSAAYVIPAAALVFLVMVRGNLASKGEMDLTEKKTT